MLRMDFTFTMMLLRIPGEDMVMIGLKVHVDTRPNVQAYGSLAFGFALDRWKLIYDRSATTNVLEDALIDTHGHSKVDDA